MSLELFSFLDHALNFFSRETALVVSDGNLIFFASALVSSRYVQYTVTINIKGDLDLWYSTRSWRDTRELKLTKKIVILSHCSLSFVDLDEYTGLVIRVGCEGLFLLLGDRGVPLDESSENSTCRLNTEGKRSNVKKEQVLDLLALVPTQDGRLDSSPIGYGLVRIDGLV